MNPNQLWLLLVAAVAITIGIFLWPGKTPQPSATVALTVEEILPQWAEALGGVEKLTGIENTYTKLEIKTAGLSGIVEEWQTVHGQRRQSVNLGDVYKSTTVYDGTKGWMLDQNGKVQQISGTNLEDEVTSAYLGSYSYLIPRRMSGKIEYLGEDESKQNYILKLLPEGGSPETYFIDKKTFLPNKIEHPEAERKRTIYLKDWRDVQGVKMPFEMKQSSPHSDVLLHAKEIRVNVPFDMALFQKLEEAKPDYSFANGTSALNIPFELTSNHIYVQGRVNNSKSLWFILDTGASASVLRRDTAKELGLKLQGELEARGAGSQSAQAAFAKGVSFSVPGVTLANQTIAVIGLPGLDAVEGRNAAGALGYDFISRFVMEIDYATRTIHLYDPKNYHYTGTGKSVPITLENGIPYTQATVELKGREPIQGRFLIDTGARAAIVLNKPLVDKHKLLEALPKKLEASFGFGVGGETKQMVGRLDKFQLLDFTLTNLITSFSQDTQGALANPNRAGLIGGDILHRFKTIFDYSRQEMILEPNGAFHEPFELDMSGAALVSEAPEYKIIKVYRIVANSPASEVGLREGDLITAIDGRSTSELTLGQVREMLTVEVGKEYQLTIQRGTELSQVKIKLRRLI